MQARVQPRTEHGAVDFAIATYLLDCCITLDFLSFSDMSALRHKQEGHLPPPLWKRCNVFLCISSYSKTLSRLIIYALFSQPVDGF